MEEMDVLPTLKMCEEGKRQGIWNQPDLDSRVYLEPRPNKVIVRNK